MSAGQVDALYVDKDGRYYLFDFKRVAKNHKLCPKEKGWAPHGEDPPCGVGPMAHLPDTHYQKYSLQTSIYNLMLHDTHGIDVGERMYLLRMHEDRAEYEQVQCRDLRSEAREALKSEQERLEAQGPPPRPAPSPAAPVGSGGPSAAGAAAGAHKRPRGNHPKGKVWHEGDGRWVRRPRGWASPVTDLTLKAKPRGRPPKGKRWNDQAECYKVCGAAQPKRKAPEQAVEAENCAPQVRQVRTRR